MLVEQATQPVAQRDRLQASKAEQEPVPRSRLRALRKNRRRLRAPRHDPHHAKAFDTANTLSMNRNFLDRHLERSKRPGQNAAAYR